MEGNSAGCVQNIQKHELVEVRHVIEYSVRENGVKNKLLVYPDGRYNVLRLRDRVSLDILDKSPEWKPVRDGNLGNGQLYFFVGGLLLAEFFGFNDYYLSNISRISGGVTRVLEFNHHGKHKRVVFYHDSPNSYWLYIVIGRLEGLLKGV